MEGGGEKYTFGKVTTEPHFWGNVRALAKILAKPMKSQIHMIFKMVAHTEVAISTVSCLDIVFQGLHSPRARLCCSQQQCRCMEPL